MLRRVAKSVPLIFHRSVKVQHLGKVMLDKKMCSEPRKTMVFGKFDLFYYDLQFTPHVGSSSPVPISVTSPLPISQSLLPHLDLFAASSSHLWQENTSMSFLLHPHHHRLRSLSNPCCLPYLRPSPNQYALLSPRSMPGQK